MIGYRVLGAAVAALLVSTLGSLAGCGTAEEKPEARSAETIKAASVALILHDAYGTRIGQGTGILLAPRVVLTAAHLVAGKARWTVTSADGKTKVNGVRGLTYDWMTYNSNKAHPRKHDVAIIYLDRPIDLPVYPVLGSEKLANGATGTRIKGSNGGGFQQLSATFSRIQGFPHAYLTNMAGGETLDTGGAVTNDRNEIVGVVTGRGMTTGQLYVARTNQLTTWLSPKIACGSKKNANLSTRTYGTPPPKPGCENGGTGTSSGTTSSSGTSGTSGGGSYGTPGSSGGSSGTSSGGTSSGSTSSGGGDNPGETCDDGGGNESGGGGGASGPGGSSAGSSTSSNGGGSYGTPTGGGGGGYDSAGKPTTGGGNNKDGSPVPAGGGGGAGGYDADGNPTTGGGHNKDGSPVPAGGGGGTPGSAGYDASGNPAAGGGHNKDGSEVPAGGGGGAGGHDSAGNPKAGGGHGSDGSPVPAGGVAPGSAGYDAAGNPKAAGGHNKDGSQVPAGGGGGAGGYDSNGNPTQGGGYDKSGNPVPAGGGGTGANGTPGSTGTPGSAGTPGSGTNGTPGSSGAGTSGTPGGEGSSEVCEGPNDNPDVCPPEADGCSGTACGGSNINDATIEYGDCPLCADASSDGIKLN